MHVLSEIENIIEETLPVNVEVAFKFVLAAAIGWLVLHVYDFVARFILFKKVGIARWKALIPFYGAALNYKAIGMSGLWAFSQLPIIIVTIFELKLPVWLTGVVILLEYGVDFVYAVHFAKSFQRKWGTGVLAFVIPRTMKIVAACSSKFKYDEKQNRLKYAYVGGKYVPASEAKKERMLLAEQERQKTIEELRREPEPPEKKGFLKKITDGIVKHHKVVLAVVTLLAAGSLVLMTRVNVNKDLTRYMPESSETSQGLNIMYSEYDEVLAMPLTVMVKDLDANEREVERDYLKNLDGVKSLDYEDSEDYHKENQTRYELTIKGKADSDNAKKVLDAIKAHYAELGKEIKLRGEVSMMNTPSLEIWVVAIAVLAALVILIVMSESYVEPVLYLISIGLAIAINMGTNAFLPSVSQVTNSITAVLQLALSMDYSIMLATEFHREKMRGKDKITAMKAALARSFTAISASSVTTIVGMLVLLMMSFTIGRDLGIVLAKGVLLCLLSIFTALPALLIIFDGLIEKTRKAAFQPKLDLLGDVAFKIRKFAVPVFLVIMGVSFAMQMRVNNLYSNTDSESIDEVFGPYNQTVILYDQEDEEKAADLCKKIEADKPDAKVMCYGNTINQPVRNNELVPQLAKLGTTTELSDEKINFVYYHAFDRDEQHAVTIGDFVDFLINADGELAKQITPEMREKLGRLAVFTRANSVHAWRSNSELAEIMNLPWDKIQDLMVLYGARYDSGARMTMPEVASFVRSSVMTNPTYAAMLPSDINDKLEMLDAALELIDWIGADTIIAIDDGINNSTITDADIREILDDLGVPAGMQSYVAKKLKTGRFLLRLLADNTSMTATDLATNLGLDSTSTRLLYSLRAQLNGYGTYGMSLSDLVYFIRDYVANSSFANRIGENEKTMVDAIGHIIDRIDAPQTASQLYELISPLSNDLARNKIELATIYHGAKTALPQDFTMTVEKLIAFLSDDMLNDDRFDEVIDDDTRQQIISGDEKITDAKEQLLHGGYGRIIIRTKLPAEGEETFAFIKQIREEIDTRELSQPAYIIGNSAMAYEMSKTFTQESNLITIVTAIVIYLVVAISFKSWSIPVLLVAIIQTAVWVTMTITGLTDGSIYFLSLIIVQSLLMGATIDYAIMYTEQFVAARERGEKLSTAVATAYNKSIQAILTSAGVLTIVTAIVGNLAGGTAAKICKTISDGTFFSTLLILLLLPAMIAACDKIIIKKKKTVAKTKKSSK
ncbi:MMPL family transporter [Candidatus Saccharibacteria bacterium]|nr:MMPL family transporter [Candidatus Saccharibacteria bacterium]